MVGKDIEEPAKIKTMETSEMYSLKKIDKCQHAKRMI